MTDRSSVMFSRFAATVSKSINLFLAIGLVSENHKIIPIDKSRLTLLPASV